MITNKSASHFQRSSHFQASQNTIGTGRIPMRICSEKRYIFYDICGGKNKKSILIYLLSILNASFIIKREN